MSGVTGDSASITPDSTAWYRAEVINGTCDPFYSDTIEVMVWANPTADAGLGAAFCEGGMDTLGGNPTASGGTAPYTYSWMPATGLSSATDANPIAMPTVTTDYVLTVTDSNGCMAMDTATVTVNSNPVVVVDTGITVNCGDTVTINSSVSGGAMPYTYLWNPSTNLSDSTSPSPVFTGFSNDTLTLTVTDNLGCTGSATTVPNVVGLSTGTDSLTYSGSIVN